MANPALDRLEIIKKIADFNRQLNSAIDKKVDTLDNRWAEVSKKYWKQLSKTIMEMVVSLDSKNGLIENTDANLAKVKRLKADLEKASRALSQEGAGFLIREGTKNLEEISKKTEDFFKTLGPGLDGFLVINPAVVRNIVEKSVLVWDDRTGELAREINSRLLDMVLRGTSVADAIKDYAKIVPAIEKPKKDGGVFKLSAADRAEITMSTEFIRMFSEAADKQATEAFGADHYVENLNPMDDRTSPICEEATLAGVMPRDEMVAEYGLPPRHPRCRCSIATMPAFLVKK